MQAATSVGPPPAPPVPPAPSVPPTLSVPPVLPVPLIRFEGRTSLFQTRAAVLGEHADWYRERIGINGPPWREAGLPRATLISRSGRRSVWRLAPGPDGEPGTILKVERPPFPGLLRRLIGPSRAEREFRNLQSLRALGFPAVEPIAHGRQGLGPFRLGTFLLTRDFEGSISLRQWARAARRPVPRAEIERLVLAMAPALASLHRGGGAIRTLFAKNILVRERPGRPAELALCDVPRFIPPAEGGFRFRRAIRDLSSLDKWASSTLDGAVRRTFLRTYLAALGLVKPPRRELIRRIRGAVDRMEHRTPMGRLSLSIKTLLNRIHLRRFWPF